MKQRLLILAILILIFSPVLTTAQTIREISPQPEMFMNELERLTKTINDRDERKQLEAFSFKFGMMWNSDTMKTDQKKDMIRTINRLLSKRYRIDPVIFDYLHTVYALVQSDNLDKNFKGFSDGLNYFIDRLPRTKVQNTITNLQGLFENGYITNYTASTWQTLSTEYTLLYDSKTRTFTLEIPKTDLVAYAYKDSTMIYNTSGYFDFNRERWHGKGGIVTWEHAGLNPDMVYAQLNEYEINMRFTKYIVDNVNFFHTKYFSEPLIGRLSNQTETGVSTGRMKTVNYPRFVSSEGSKVIKDIFPNIDYTGGFSMLGARLVASSSESGLASIIINRDGKPFMRLKSKDFAMDSIRIVSRLASVTMYLEEDSIYHPAIRFTYEDDRKLLSLYRDQQGLSRSPFFDTYHMIDIDVEAIFWNVEEEKIQLKNMPSASGMNTAYFRSMNFFDAREFAQIKGMDRVNPLYLIQDFHNKMGLTHFHLDDITRFIGYAPHMVKAMLLRMANMGFLAYDLDTDMITIRERLFIYLKARRGMVDYDVISFNSETRRKSNAELSLLDNNLSLYGVRLIQLSDSQNVVIDPAEDKLTLKKNRDFKFNGKVKAGRFVIHGNDFEFSYDKFRIEMPLIDSLEFWVKPFKEHEDKYAERKYVESVIQDMQGKLLIDHPGNKSGIKPFPQYPILNSETNSYVYYDKNCIYKNVYEQNEFYYRLEPFTIDSLDNFSTDGLQFEGYLASAGIFPVIEHPLSVQKDYSLGFIYQTPATGYTTYGGKGHFNNEIMLSNDGLEGNGTLKYLTAEARSKEFDFFPDSTNALAYSYVVKAQEGQVEYPSVDGQNVYIHWEPYNDFMTVESRETSINMFEQQASIDGKLNYSPEMMKGSGVMHIADADIDSRLFKYRKQLINADTCNFKLNTKDSEFGLGAGDKIEQDLITSNYKAEISFIDRKGEFTSNSGSSQVKFPVNQYISFIDRFTWYMDKDEVEFSTKVSDELAEKYDGMSMKEMADIDLQGARFISIHPAQDSLEFRSDKAIYSRKDQTIKANGVRMIRVADAAIFPGDQKVTIFRRAEMEELSDAKILANTTTKFHTVNDATINIKGRFSYFGRGNYDYVDKNDDIQKIYLNNIYVDSTSMTNALGKIKEEDKFTLSPAFKYKGNVKLVSTNEYLNFDGGFQIRNHCDTLPKQWVHFNSIIIPDDVKIPIDSTMLNMNDRETYASILHAKDQKQIYSSFYVFDNTHRLRAGNQVFTSTGVLIYDEISSEYRIAPEEKLKQRMLPGNYTSYNTRDCIHTGEGTINFFEETGQVDLQTIGKIEHFVHEDSTQIKGVLAIDFFFSDKALEKMAENINSYNTLPGVELNNDRFKQALMEMLGKEKADEVISELTIYNRIRKMPKELEKTMLLTDVSLKWDERAESFISTGKVGIAYLGDEQVTKYVDAYIIFSKGRRGGFTEGEFTILLEVSSAEWYYFNYKSTGAMTVVGSSDEFKTIINELKPKDRKMDTKTGETPFRYNLGGSMQREQFLRNIRRITGEQ